jgi:hypothetical protein
MKVEIDGGPKTLDGEPFLDEKQKPLNFKTIICNALLANYQDEASLPGKEKLDRWHLAQRVHGSGVSIEVTAEEISSIKNLVAKGYSTPVSAQVWEILEKGTSGEVPPMPKAVE